MGSYAECWLGSFYVGATKGHFDPALMGLFRSADKNVVRGKKRELPFQMRRWHEVLEDDEEVSAVFYQAPVSVVRDRLELKGYTLDTAKSAFTTSSRAQALRYAQYMERSDSKALEPFARELEAVDVDQWLEAMRSIRAKDREQSERRENENETTLAGHMLEREWYGYSGPDLAVALRLALEVCSDGDELIYDVTDLVMGGYFSAEDDFVSLALAPTLANYSSDSKTVVLTEGRSDSWIIFESLKLFYPHLVDYFTFMDFEGARVGGGAGSLANIVKAFAGAGILNRVVAIFDNDTAAEAAIRSLRSVCLPKNIQILRLPEYAALREYPTVGPSGSIDMNVNSIAASIELYLGADVLSNEQGELAPVQWTGYDASLGKYQGEVLFKDKIQERFRRRLETCRTDLSVVDRTEWTGVRLILSAIFVAFHQVDGEQIREFASEDPNF